jgi:3-oxoacyl-[acyl-carrier protein] reductase
LDLEGRVAYVTGSTRGIGRAIAGTLAAHGARVVVNGWTSEAAVEATAKAIATEHGVETLAVFADQADATQSNAAFRKIFDRFGRLDVLVNNAGIVDDALLGMIAESSITRTFGVNALGLVRNIQSGARLMQRNRSGSIVNMSSIMGVRGNPGEVVYAASKAAVIGMTLSAAKELAPQGIRVNALAPGFIDTDLTRALPPQVFAERAQRIGMGRVGVPQDVAGVALFLASDLSAYVTGQVIGVDGAMVI